MIHNVVILEVAWGRGGRWFHINPRNFSGKRLHEAFGVHPFVVTNACPEVVGHAYEHAKPDVAWLRHNLLQLQPSFVLVCGGVARKTFATDMVESSCKVMYAAHPAARSWTRAMLAQLHVDVQVACSEISSYQTTTGLLA